MILSKVVKMMGESFGSDEEMERGRDEVWLCWQEKMYLWKSLDPLRLLFLLKLNQTDQTAGGCHVINTRLCISGVCFKVTCKT